MKLLALGPLTVFEIFIINHSVTAAAEAAAADIDDSNKRKRFCVSLNKKHVDGGYGTLMGIICMRLPQSIAEVAYTCSYQKLTDNKIAHTLWG